MYRHAIFAKINLLREGFQTVMNLNEKCLLKFLQYPDDLISETALLEEILEELAAKNE